MHHFKFSIIVLIHLSFCLNSIGQELPKILTTNNVSGINYLPDFSYAGYHNGAKKIPTVITKIVFATDYGVIPNDGLDDSKALIKAITEASKHEGNVVLQLPAGRMILSEIIYIKRSNFVLRGTGSGNMGTALYFPRPLMYVKDPDNLQELREYLKEFNKRQKEKENNIDLPFSQYAWSGGFIWTKVPNQRVKSYLAKYDKPYNVLSKVKKGDRSALYIEVETIENIRVGDILELQLFNKDGEEGEIIKELYKDTSLKVGGHHWNFPNLPLVRQQIEVKEIVGNKVIINAPLTIDIKPSYQAQLVEWKHLREVGIENLRFQFPKSPRIAHHVEQGFNAIYLTRVYDSWVKNVVIDNADSGILTEEIANVTITDVTTQGENMAHYTVMMQGTYNVLAENIKVQNKAVHPLSFNTFASKSVYTDCEVFVDPILDQHSGANHQNLFDNIRVHISKGEENSYPLFEGGGAGYWKPCHGAYSTFWNIQVQLLDGLDTTTPFLLDGMKKGPFANVIGVTGNQIFEVKYGPESHIEFVNQSLENIPSLYTYQLKKRF